MSSKQYSFLTLPLTSLNQICIHILAFLLNSKIGWGLRNLNLDLLVYPILIKCGTGIYTQLPKTSVEEAIYIGGWVGGVRIFSESERVNSGNQITQETGSA